MTDPSAHPGTGPEGTTQQLAQDAAQPTLDAPAAPPAPKDDPDPDPDTAGDDRPAAREAARYRRRLREAEAERDTLAERVERMQRAEVERLAGTRLSVGADIFTVGGAALAELLDEHGNVAPERVSAAADELVSARPGLAPSRWPDMGQGNRGAAAPARSWARVLGGPR